MIPKEYGDFLGNSGDGIYCLVINSYSMHELDWFNFAN